MFMHYLENTIYRQGSKHIIGLSNFDAVERAGFQGWKKVDIRCKLIGYTVRPQELVEFVVPLGSFPAK